MCPVSAPVKIFFILTLHTLRQWLDWPLISILTSQPMHKMCSGPSKKNFCHQFTRKLLIAEILKRCLLVAKKVPYNSQMTLHENCWPFMPQTDDLCFGPQRPLTRMAIAQRTVNVEFFWISVEPSQIDWHLHANFWVKIPNIQHSRIWQLFDTSKNLKKSTLNGPRNGQSVTYSKIQTKVCRGTLDCTYGLMLDEIGQCRVPSKLPQMCRKSGTFGFEAPPEPPSVSHPPKMVPPYSPGICPPKTPPSLIKESSLLHWEKIDFLRPLYFAISTRTALESPKIHICQNWPERVLGHVISCLESKFEKKIPMGSVPN